MAGVDSAFGPTLDQAHAAKSAGALWWGFYVGGASAFHTWTGAEVDVLTAAGFELALPIFVPLMDGGRIWRRADPEHDAAVAMFIASTTGWRGAVALDTEASMRGDSWTHEYERRFGDHVQCLGWQACTYAGGFTFSSPPAHRPWWIEPGPAPAGVAHQTGQATYLGLTVDTDSAGAGFPLATHS